MQLNHHGIAYDYTPPRVAMAPAELAGQHSTLEWRYRNRRKLPIQPATVNLMYRDIHQDAAEPSSVKPPVVIEEQPVVSPQASLAQEIARSLMTAHHILTKRREQSLLERAAAEIGLETDAASYWHPIQGKINPSLWANYDRSAVALS